MKNSLYAEILTIVKEQSLKSVSFDIDGTVYPIVKVQLRWWKNFFISPGTAIRFFNIKKTWEKRRLGDVNVPVSSEDVRFFEDFLTSMLDQSLVPDEIRNLIKELRTLGVEVLFLSDHGAAEKLSRLGLTGKAINCLIETGHLKPHQKISDLLRQHGIVPESHLHLGDRWTDEEQARLFGCSFLYLQL
jgi:FMN phosphatase YigB (HAD superfamily)